MSKFHVNGEGNPGKCTAEKGNCPFGGEDAHHGSAQEARAAFEQAQSPATLGGVSKKAASAENSTKMLQAAAEDLRETVRDYRHPATTEGEREQIRAHWKEKGVKNQFSAMLKAAELEKEAAASEPEPEASAPMGPGAIAEPADLEAMPPTSRVLWDGESHRKGADGHWYYGFGGASRRSQAMAGAVVKENAAVPLLPTVETPELTAFMAEVDGLQESFPPHIRKVRSLSEPVQTLRTAGDSRDYKFALSLLKERIEDHEEFINEEAMDDRTSVRWLSAIESAERKLGQGW